MDRMLTREDRQGLERLYTRFLSLRGLGMPAALVTAFRAKRGALKARQFRRFRTLERESMRAKPRRAWRALGRG